VICTIQVERTKKQAPFAKFSKGTCTSVCVCERQIFFFFHLFLATEAPPEHKFFDQVIYFSTNLRHLQVESNVLRCASCESKVLRCLSCESKVLRCLSCASNVLHCLSCESKVLRYLSCESKVLPCPSCESNVLRCLSCLTHTFGLRSCFISLFYQSVAKVQRTQLMYKSLLKGICNQYSNSKSLFRNNLLQGSFQSVSNNLTNCHTSHEKNVMRALCSYLYVSL